MANAKQVELLKQGVAAWNQWKEKRFLSKYRPLLGIIFRRFRLDLSDASLRDSDLRHADLQGLNLNGVDLSYAEMHEAYFNTSPLIKANLSHAAGIDASFSQADLSNANLSDAVFYTASFYDATLIGANLRKTNFSGADLRKARLSGANLSGAILVGADLTGAICDNTDFSGADLAQARLIDTTLNDATLTGAYLWQTQRAGWTIRRVICESVYWDKEKEKLETYANGVFERLFSERARIQLTYPGGINTIEIVTLPSLIQHLESSHSGCRLRLQSIEDTSGGAVVTIVIDDTDDGSPEKIEKLRAEIKSEAEQEIQHFRLASQRKDKRIERLKGKVKGLKWSFNEASLNQKPTVFLEKGDLRMGDTINIKGDNNVTTARGAQVQGITFNNIGHQIEESTDLSELAKELSELCQAMKKEVAGAEQFDVVIEISNAAAAAQAKDSSKLAEHLRAAGQWAFDFASGTGASLVANAIAISMGWK